MNATDTEPKPTQLILYYGSGDDSSFIRERLTNIPRIIQASGYKFQYEMPVVVVELTPPKKETYLNWRGKEREREVYEQCSYCFLLRFSKELTEEELTFWRIFKLGYLTRELSPRAIRVHPTDEVK
jgi:hypothetical protein